jgi:hypothetical protein
MSVIRRQVVDNIAKWVAGGHDLLLNTLSLKLAGELLIPIPELFCGWHGFLPPVAIFNLTFKMNFFAQKLRKLLSASSAGPVRYHRPFDIVKTKNGIRRELQISMESGSLVGLFSPALSDGMLLVVVLRLESQGSAEAAILAKYDITGNLLSTNTLAMSEIKGICPFVKGRRATLITH